MKKVLELFKELLQFLKSYGDSRITPQYRALQGAIEYLESEALEEDKIDCIEACYRTLYPPREGLSEFYVYNKDDDKMKEINNELDRIKRKLGRAVAEVLDQ
ncbi:hypothetical protein [Butyrivibrio sp. AE3004]|uniref:hypothetical protein n=1 Tax=Butyrivibrio sp. AE3004 TaxID=1506994 RepID=UPI000493E8F7|nr:hypothetical protein [Butyrivibrio sp. AE3004]